VRSGEQRHAPTSPWATATGEAISRERVDGSCSRLRLAICREMCVPTGVSCQPPCRFTLSGIHCIARAAWIKTGRPDVVAARTTAEAKRIDDCARAQDQDCCTATRTWRLSQFIAGTLKQQTNLWKHSGVAG